MRTLTLASIMALLVACAVPALAADGLPGATVGSDSGMTPAERRARFEQWCKDNPEKCREMKARAERCKADPEKCRAEMQAQSEQRFRKADSNGDGKLSREEARKGMPAVAKNFDAIDANKDGFVTMEELKAMQKMRGGPRKGSSGPLGPAAATLT